MASLSYYWEPSKFWQLTFQYKEKLLPPFSILIFMINDLLVNSVVNSASIY